MFQFKKKLRIDKIQILDIIYYFYNGKLRQRSKNFY